MQITRSLFVVCGLLLIEVGTMVLFLSGCKKEYLYEYEVNEQTIEPITAGKDKLKTPEQYVSILFVNLFQRPLSANDIYDISRVLQSIGDKQLANEVLISNFMNKPDVILPSNASMRGNLPAFVDDVYERFLLRPPTELEKTYFINYIEARPNISPELVYYAFALANEYQFY